MATAVVLTLALPGAVTCAGSVLGMESHCAMPMDQDCSPAGSSGNIGSDCCVVDSQAPAHATVPAVPLPGPSTSDLAASAAANLSSLVVAPVAASLEVLERSVLHIPPHSIHLLLSIFLI